ncbi:AI-2E family transporter [Bradyrhizobium jicamae]|uniref:AI-2E family transporter n=1 Tax=Bradyrhizobium jicamae TaxID=280332 RepID=A0ABS5FXN2_9BRAD|nr:AI-2E family transporter [Bradyrhizobium jicamae]MBR0801491.1 AI-2E family transporter [Bradyrhizobium jicamae]
MQIDPVKSVSAGDEAPIRVASFSVIFALIIAALYLGREVFVPISLAVLLSFVLAPAVRLLQRIHIPRALAVLGSVGIAFMLLFVVGSIIAKQLNQLAGDLPQYQATIVSKIDSVRGIAGGSTTLERAAAMLKQLGEEIQHPAANAPAASHSNGDNPVVAKPLKVEVLQPDPGALENIRVLIAPLISPLATTGIIIIFVVFILIQREDLRNRVIRLFGSNDLQRTTAAIDDAASRLSKLFLNQLLINSSFGLAIGIGLTTIGIPRAILWGILAAVLRFVPYIGSLIAALFPLALALAVDPGWSMLIGTLALFLIVEPVVGHVVEPMVYGRSTGLSPVAVVLSATFWTALWGPVGLVMATPLTVCLVVLGRHVERLAFLDVMFGDRPALSPPEIFYQRMLAGDPTEAAEMAEEFLKERSLSAYMEEVALRGLLLAKSDCDRGKLNNERMERINTTVEALCEDFANLEDRIPDAGSSTNDVEAVAALDAMSQTSMQECAILDRQSLPAPWSADRAILCLGGASPLDDAAAALLAQLLDAHGLNAGTERLGRAIRGPGVGATRDSAVIFLSYLGDGKDAQIRFAVRQLGRLAPNVPVLVGCWSFDGGERSPVQGTPAYRVVRSFREGTAYCVRHAQADIEKVISLDPTGSFSSPVTAQAS